MTAIKCKSCNANMGVGDISMDMIKCPYCGTSHTLASTVSYGKGNCNRFSLYTILCDHADFTDLKKICFFMKESCKVRIRYEDIIGQTLSEKCLELITFRERRSATNHFVAAILSIRPDLYGYMV